MNRTVKTSPHNLVVTADSYIDALTLQSDVMRAFQESGYTAWPAIEAHRREDDVVSSDVTLSNQPNSGALIALKQSGDDEPQFRLDILFLGHKPTFPLNYMGQIILEQNGIHEAHFNDAEVILTRS